MKASKTPPLRQLALPGTSSFVVHYSPVPRPTQASFDVLGDKFHPIHLKTKRKYAEKDRNTLWWNSIVYASVASKSVLRSWCCRRLRLAFSTALKESGFDSEGRVLPGTVGQAGTHRKTGLKGSLTLTARPALLTAKFAVVQQSARDALGAVVKSCYAATKDNRSKARPDRPALIRHIVNPKR